MAICYSLYGIVRAIYHGAPTFFVCRFHSSSRLAWWMHSLSTHACTRYWVYGRPGPPPCCRTFRSSTIRPSQARLLIQPARWCSNRLGASIGSTGWTYRWIWLKLTAVSRIVAWPLRKWIQDLRESHPSLLWPSLLWWARLKGTLARMFRIAPEAPRGTHFAGGFRCREGIAKEL